MTRDTIDIVRLADGSALPAEIHQASGMQGFVILASENARYDSPCRRVSHALNSMGFKTLRLGLRTAEEEQRGERRDWLHDHLDLFARRLRAAVGWVRDELGDVRQPLGCFAMQTAAAAALLAAAQEPSLLQAVVCSEGRPDYAGLALRAVASPTLLIVPERDPMICDLNRDAYDHLTCTKHLEIVYGAAQLSQAPAAVTRIEQAAAAWFGWYLQAENATNPP